MDGSVADHISYYYSHAELGAISKHSMPHYTRCFQGLCRQAVIQHHTPQIIQITFTVAQPQRILKKHLT